jgi:hypothetical protein
MDKARRIYNEMILGKSDIGKITSTIWIEFFELERQYGDEKHQRKLLNRALGELTDNSEKEIIYDTLIKFEKLNGSVHQYTAVYAKYEQFKAAREADIAEKRAKSKKAPLLSNAGVSSSQNGQKTQGNAKSAGNKVDEKKKNPQAKKEVQAAPGEKSNNLKRKVSVAKRNALQHITLG